MPIYLMKTAAQHALFSCMCLLDLGEPCFLRRQLFFLALPTRFHIAICHSLTGVLLPEVDSTISLHHSGWLSGFWRL